MLARGSERCRFPGTVVRSESGKCGVPASLSSLPPAGSLAEPSCSPFRRPPTELRRPEGTLRPTPERVSLLSGPTVTFHPRPRASLTHSGSGLSLGSPASRSSSQTGSPSRQLGAPRTHAQGQLPRLRCGAPAGASWWARPRPAHFRDSARRPLPRFPSASQAAGLTAPSRDLCAGVGGTLAPVAAWRRWKRWRRGRHF